MFSGKFFSYKIKFTKKKLPDKSGSWLIFWEEIWGVVVTYIILVNEKNCAFYA